WAATAAPLQAQATKALHSQPQPATAPAAHPRHPATAALLQDQAAKAPHSQPQPATAPAAQPRHPVTAKPAKSQLASLEKTVNPFDKGHRSMNFLQPTNPQSMNAPTQ